MIDRQGLHEIRSSGHDLFIETVKSYCNGACLDAGSVKDVLESHVGPARIAHRTVAPLSAWHARLEKPVRLAGALIDRHKVDGCQRQKILKRQAEIGVDQLRPKRPAG